MSASTSWWYCGQCGFRNHPREKQDVTKCEQCGASQEHKSAVDYVPTDSRP